MQVFGLFLTHPLCSDSKQKWPFYEPTQSNDCVIYLNGPLRTLHSIYIQSRELKENIGQKIYKFEQKSLQETTTFSLFEVFFYFFCYCRLGITGKPTSLVRRFGRVVGTGEAGGTIDPRFWQTNSPYSNQEADHAHPITTCPLGF